MAENELTLQQAETPPAAEVPPEAEPQAPEPTDAPLKAVDEGPDPTRLQADIEALEAKRKKAEEDALYWRKQKAEARADYFKGQGAQPPAQQPPVPGVGPEPKPSDYEDYDKYVSALTDYRVKAARAEWENDQRRREAEKTMRERHENLQAKLQEGFQKYPDFEEVAFDQTATHITPMIVEILADCDHPADLAYYLAKNRVEGVAISRMTPLQAARAIARLEAKIEAEANAAPPPQARKTTSAPPPIKPLGASASAGIQKDPEKMTQKEYEQWRASQGARRF